MTLIETLVALFIFITAALGVLQVFLSSVYLSESVKGKSTMMYHLENMMEKIRCTPFTQMTVLFPHTLQDGPVANPYATITGGYTLQNEHIVVSYQNPTADPLEVTVTGTWQTSQGRTISRRFSTLKTR